MPNWCLGSVKVKGYPEDVREFCKLFLFEKDDFENKKQYFARSFIHETWEEFEKNYLSDKHNEAEFSVNFAWSCNSCLIDGYPQDTEECITLKEACQKYDVSVEIDSEEGGCGFEEHIRYTREEDLTYTCVEMPKYKCPECDNIQIMPSDSDLENVECWECGNYPKWKKLAEGGKK